MRFVPDIPFPPYTFVPGLTPHPNHPGGHSFGRQPPRPERPNPERWWECQAFLYGADLFNHGYYWEAHETWEGLWRACGGTGQAADFLRGLIKLAAAGVKVRQGVPMGVASHARRAAAIFRGAAERLNGLDARVFGLRLGDLLVHARAIEAMAVTIKGDHDEGVKIVFPFVLFPQTANTP